MILKHQILPKVLLRRTKMDCAGDLALPPRRLVVRKDPFDAREADFYEALYTQSQAAFGGCAPSRATRAFRSRWSGAPSRGSRLNIGRG